MTRGNVRERWTAAAAILTAFLGGGAAIAQQPIDLNNDGVNDTVRREIRLHQTDPVIGRIVLVSGVDDTGFLSIATKTPNDMFGWYVSPIGDLDADGFEDLAVTAPASLIADGLGPNDPGGPVPAWRGRVQLVSGATGAELMTIFNPEATANCIFGLGAAIVPDQDADGMPDLVVAGSCITPAPTPENPNATASEWRWWVMSTATTESIRMGTGQVGSVGCEFLMIDESPYQFWLSNEAPGGLEILPGLAGDMDGDGDVDAGDAAALIGEWTSGTPGVTRIGDLNNDGLVGATDLSILLSLIGFPPDLIESLGLASNMTTAYRNSCPWYGCPPGPMPCMYEPGGCTWDFWNWNIGFGPPIDGGGGDCPGCPNGPPPCTGPCCTNPCPCNPCCVDPCSCDPCAIGCTQRGECEGEEDDDNDGIPNDQDNDDDNDGIPDDEELGEYSHDTCRLLVGFQAISAPSSGFRPVGDAIAIAPGEELLGNFVFAADPMGLNGYPSAVFQWTFSGAELVEEHEYPSIRRVRVTEPGLVTATVTASGVRWNDSHTEVIPCSVTASYSFTVFSVRLKAVSFGGAGFRNVTRDGDTTVTPNIQQSQYELPQWHDTNLDGDANDDDPGNPNDDKRYPVCYVRGSRLTLPLVILELDSGNAPLPPMTIWGYSTNLSFVSSLNVGSGVGTAGPLQSLTPAANGVATLDNTVGREERAINWRIRWDRDGRVAWRDVGTSSNKIYRTASLPATATLYETLLNLACNTAWGWPRRGLAEGAPDQDEQQLVDYIWSEFADKNVKRTDEQQLGYYRGGPCDFANGVLYVADLLKQTNGQCGSWADLLVRCLQAQGVSGVQMVRVDPIRTGAGTVADCVVGNEDLMGFLVNLYTFTGAGTSGCGNYPFRINAPCTPAQDPLYWPATDVTDGSGTAGQHSTDPASFFNLHYIVKHGNRFFDPSYGKGPYTGSADEAALLWENASIAGYYGRTLTPHQGQNEARFVARQGTAAREIVFTPFNPLP